MFLVIAGKGGRGDAGGLTKRWKSRGIGGKSATTQL